MQPSQLVADSLWHCLCPSFARTLSSSIPRTLPRPRPRLRPRPSPVCLRARQYSATTAEPWDPMVRGPMGGIYHNADAEPSRIERIAGFRPHFDILPGATSTEFSGANRGRFLRRLRRFHQEDTDTIYRVLREVAKQADPLAVENWVRFLITKRGEKPNAKMYAALLEACCHPEYGSVARIRGLLEEMEHNGVQHEPRTRQAALRALSVHPSYTLRADLLQDTKDHWVDLSAGMLHHVCCAQLREKQVELALDTLRTMFRDHGIPPQTYLLTMFVHVLAELGEFDILWDIFNMRRNPRYPPPSKQLWLAVLTKAAEHLNYPIVYNIWSLVVSTGDLNPSTGVANMVLDTATRAGDPELAIDVFRILGQRNSPIHAHQQEAFVEAHLRAKSVDMVKVLSYIASLERSSPETIGKILRPPFWVYFRDKPHEIEVTIKHMRDLRDEKKQLFPVELLNTVMEAAINNSQFALAMNTYKDLHKFSESGTVNPATRDTFRILLAGCHESPQKDTAMFLAAEMIALKIQPDRSIYNSLIQACLAGNAGDSEYDRTIQLRHLKDAGRWLNEMLSSELCPEQSTWNKLGIAAAKLNDESVEELLVQMKKNGMDTKEIKDERSYYQHHPFPWKGEPKKVAGEPDESLKHLADELREWNRQ